MRVVSHALVDTRGGRATLQSRVAALVLLGGGRRRARCRRRTARARRAPLAARARRRARARVRAGRCVARSSRGGSCAGCAGATDAARGARARDAHGDAAFLARRGRAPPPLAGDVERLLRGVDTPDPDAVARSRAAAAAVDRALTPPPSTHAGALTDPDHSPARPRRASSTRSAACATRSRARVVGQDAAIDDALVAVLARGHVLLEGVPGVGEDAARAHARRARSARASGASSSRPT